MVLGNGSGFEGNSGTTILKLPVTLGGTPTSDVHGFASAVAISGTGFHPATAGAACGGSVDFVSFSNVPFTIPAGFTGPLSVNITVCGDTTIEPDEQIFVFLSNVTGGAFCTSESCAAIGTIVNDDGPPSMSINDISVTEPFGSGSTKTAFFTVTLHHLTNQTVTAHYATSSCPLFCEFVPTSGTLSIPPNTFSGTIPVTIRNDGIIEGSSQSFSVSLSSPTNATILKGTGVATIAEAPLFSPGIGAFALSPDNAVVENGDTLAFDVTWTVPDGENWHDLKSLDFRIGSYGSPVLWVRWDEASNSFSLCSVGGMNANQAHQSGGPTPANCGAASAPGSDTPLFTPSAQLVLADTTVTGSGPTGPSVTLHLVVSFGPEISAHSYPIWLSVADDFGNVDNFVRAGEVTVEE